MLNTPIFNVCTGLIFLFLLYSLLATIIQEVVARWLGLRPRVLYKGIQRMLEDRKTATHLTFVDFFIDTGKAIKTFFTPQAGQQTFTQKFYKHPSIKYLGENSWSSKPSYINAGLFAQTLIQILRGEEYDGKTTAQADLIRNTLESSTLQIDNETRNQLKEMFADAQGDVDKFRLMLEQWYNTTMERVSGWYKRKVQFVLFLIGLAIAASFNVDTIAIYRILSKDPKVREQLVQLALQKKEGYGVWIDTLQLKHTPDTGAVHTIPHDTIFEQAYQTLQSDLYEVQNILALGWGNTAPASDSLCIAEIEQFYNEVKEKKLKGPALQKRLAQLSTATYRPGTPSVQQSWLQMLGGWIITALAISLGAPFWFDLLNKITNLRGAAKPDSTKPDTSAGDRTALQRVG